MVQPNHEARAPDEGVDNDIRNLAPVSASELDIRNLARHPLSDFYGDMQDEEWEDFHKGLDDAPVPEFLNVVLYEGKILDGYHRYHWAVNNQKEHFIRFLEFTGDNPTNFVNMMNSNRRHLTTQDRARIATLTWEYNKSNRPSNGARMTQQEISEELQTTPRQMQRVSNTNKAGLGDYLRAGAITAEDGEQMSRNGMAELVLNGELTIEAAKERTRVIRRQKREEYKNRKEGRLEPAAATPVDAPPVDAPVVVAEPAVAAVAAVAPEPAATAVVAAPPPPEPPDWPDAAEPDDPTDVDLTYVSLGEPVAAPDPVATPAPLPAPSPPATLAPAQPAPVTVAAMLDPRTELERTRNRVRELEAYCGSLEAERDAWKERAELAERERDEMRDRLEIQLAPVGYGDAGGAPELEQIIAAG